MSRLSNRLIARVFTAFPWLARRAAASVVPMSYETTPWTPLKKPLSECRVSLATTAGVHMRGESPFNMADTTGDPTFRVIPAAATTGEIMITHDYYDHRDADRDVNVVFPLDRLREFAAGGRVGGVASRHYGFMGHILENQIDRFVDREIPRVAAMMKDDGVDVALITPG
ncbi:MAG: hypothetical protein HQK87_01550 [Nitrospinae bacterium]|nr:hypothetical protein [Nitrospinota bacterium]